MGSAEHSQEVIDGCRMSVYTTEKTDLWGELTHVIAKRSQVHFPGPLDFPLFYRPLLLGEFL